jgi:nucleoside-diphosphate-sugar epimerase
MRVLVCGGAGFTGRAVVEELLNAGHSVRAWDLNSEAWLPGQLVKNDESLMDSPRLERVYGSIADHDLAERYLIGCHAIVHCTMLFPRSPKFAATADIPGAAGQYSSLDYMSDEDSWLVNLKGLWNILEAARHQDGIVRVVHIGSADHHWPGVPHLPGKEQRGSVFMDQDVRRIDGDLYGIHKRLQEEMCRQFYDAFGLRIIVLRPSWILDVEQHISRTLPVKSWQWPDGAVCRRQLGMAACGAIRDNTTASDFFCLHAVALPHPPVSDYDPRRWCNVGLAPIVLDGFEFSLDVQASGYHGPQDIRFHRL